MLVFTVPTLWGLSFWYRDWPSGAIAAAMSVYLVLEARNLVQARRAARKGPKSRNG